MEMVLDPSVLSTKPFCSRRSLKYLLWIRGNVRKKKILMETVDRWLKCNTSRWLSCFPEGKKFMLWVQNICRRMFFNGADKPPWFVFIFVEC